MKSLDDGLLRALRRRKQESFRRLFDDYYAVLCAVAWEYVKDEAAAESVVEDVMMEVWEQGEALEKVVSLQAYLVRAVRNRSIDYLRSCKRSQEGRMSLEDQRFIDTGFMTEEALFGRILLSELSEKIEEAIAGLPEECRQVFCLSRQEDKSYEEIALLLEISVNTVKYHMKRALRILREVLKDYLPELILFCSAFL